MTEDDLIRVHAKLRYARPSPSFGPGERPMAVIKCPFCGKRHEHGWGSGARVAHCDGITLGKEYYIVCEEGAEFAP